MDSFFILLNVAIYFFDISICMIIRIWLEGSDLIGTLLYYQQLYYIIKSCGIFLFNFLLSSLL